MIGEGDSVAVLILLDHLNVQGVVDQQSGVITAQGEHDVLGEVTEQAQAGSLGVGVDGPVGAHEALDGGIVAGGHQQHLGSLGGSHTGGGVEGAVAAAGDDAQGVAVVDVALGPVVADVGQLAVHAGIQLVVVNALIHDDGDHLRHLVAAHGPLGIIAAVGLAVDHAQGGEHGNGVLVHDLIAVGEIVVAHSGSADDHHADQHNGGQSQAESPFEVSHLEFLLLNFRVPGRHILKLA